MWLDNLLEDFIFFIKNEHFTVTTNQKLLIIKSLKEIDILDKNKVFSVFSSIIINDKNQYYNFKELFFSFFKNVNLLFLKDSYSENKEKNYGNSFLDTVLSSYKLNKYNYNMSVKTFILNDKNRIDRLIRLAISNLDQITINNFGLSFNKVKNLLNIDNLEYDILIFRKELERTGASKFEVDEIINKIMFNLKQFKKNIRVSLRKSAENTKENNKLELGIELDLKSIDIKSIEDSAKKLAKRLKNKKSKRSRKSNNGLINIKKTLKKSMAYNGVPFQKVFKKQKNKKRELIILTDISDSVKKYSKTILYYIYSLNNFFTDIKTFTFIANSKDISDKFKEKLSFEEISSYLGEGGNSDYNSAFDSFNKQFYSKLNKSVIFIIIGDARNNYISADLSNIVNIHKRVRDIIWLNPENKLFWSTTDSNMPDYQRVIKNCYQIRTIKDIEEFSERIVLK